MEKLSDYLSDYYIKRFKEITDENTKNFMLAFEQGSDRAVAIIAACLLDNLLERLIRAFFIKDPSVKMIFKNDHILQSLFAKINIAYFSGLIPKVTYHDLKLICEIRNKFAHEVTANLAFKDSIISQRIDKCETRPKTIDNIPAVRLKFILIIAQIIGQLCCFEQLLLLRKPPNLVESFKLNDTKWEELALTKEEITDIIQGKRKKSKKV